MKLSKEDPIFIIEIGILLTIIVAVESLYVVPWSPYFLIYAALAIWIPLRYKSYKFSSLRSAFNRRNLINFLLFFIAIFLLLLIVEQLYIYTLSVYNLLNNPIYDLSSALNELAIKAGKKFSISTDSAIGIYGVYVLVWAPIGEELFYRGLLFGELRKQFNFKTSAIASSFFFGVRHMTHFLFLLPLYPFYAALYWAFHAFIFGILISYSYEKTDTLYVPIIIHFLYNLVDSLI